MYLRVCANKLEGQQICHFFHALSPRCVFLASWGEMKKNKRKAFKSSKNIKRLHTDRFF